MLLVFVPNNLKQRLLWGQLLKIKHFVDHHASRGSTVNSAGTGPCTLRAGARGACYGLSC